MSKATQARWKKHDNGKWAIVADGEARIEPGSEVDVVNRQGEVKKVRVGLLLERTPYNQVWGVR